MSKLVQRIQLILADNSDQVRVVYVSQPKDTEDAHLSHHIAITTMLLDCGVGGLVGIANHAQLVCVSESISIQQRTIFIPYTSECQLFTAMVCLPVVLH